MPEGRHSDSNVCDPRHPSDEGDDNCRRAKLEAIRDPDLVRVHCRGRERCLNERRMSARKDPLPDRTEPIVIRDPDIGCRAQQLWSSFGGQFRPLSIDCR